MITLWFGRRIKPRFVMSRLLQVRNVFQNKLLVMDMWFKATKRRRRKFEPRVRVWKLKEEKTCEEFRCMVGDKLEEANWKGLCVNDHWQLMKCIMMETAQDMWYDQRTTQTQRNMLVE